MAQSLTAFAQAGCCSVSQAVQSCQKGCCHETLDLTVYSTV